MLLTQTAETAIKVGILLARAPLDDVVSVKQIAAALGGSETYMAKTVRELVKAGILRSFRGPGGGVTLARPPEAISLLQIVEASQGVVGENYCDGDLAEPCPYHVAMLEVREAVIGVLSRWDLQQLSARCPVSSTCKIALPELPPKSDDGA